MNSTFPTFLNFLSQINENLHEANAYGSSFEKTIALNIQKWIIKNQLGYKYTAKRYQTLSEFDGNRDEDYSDVIITDKYTKDKIFLECKQSLADNISQLMVNIINKNGKIMPIVVKGLERDYATAPIYKELGKYISKNNEFKKFSDFLTSPTIINNKKYIPGDFFFDQIEADEKLLTSLILKYNKLLDKQQLTTRNKKFNTNIIRKSTANMLACGLLWRLGDATRTWDICHITLRGKGFSEMIKHHYLNDKAVPTDYIQIGNDTLFRFTENNLLNIECDILPEKIIGQFDLKFTPRFGTGSMYITSRSKIAQTLTSSTSFGNEEKWPKYLG